MLKFIDPRQQIQDLQSYIMPINFQRIEHPQKPVCLARNRIIHPSLPARYSSSALAHQISQCGLRDIEHGAQEPKLLPSNCVW